MTRTACTCLYDTYGIYGIIWRRGKAIQSHRIRVQGLLTCQHILGLLAITVVCGPLLLVRTAGAEPTDARGSASGATVGKDDQALGEGCGPTVILSYGTESLGKNPISSFMYFVPLTSLTLVDRQTSANNEQEVVVVSYDRKVDARYFYVAVEFEIRGKGFHQTLFDPVGMIASHTGGLRSNEALTHTLDYIRFEGEGFGRIEVKGKIRGLNETVTEVDLQFNARGRKSPVTIGLYDIEPKDGEYRYENRTNKLVARVNTLAFRRSDRAPRMGVRVASISRSAEDGFFARVWGGIANLLLTPPKISELGNETMLNFGQAILKQESEFTFPKAENIEEEETVAASTLAP